MFKGKISIGDQEIQFTDSPISHGFTFTPASSLFVTCASEDEQTKIFNTLSTDGKVLMPLGNYGFSTKFAWVNDKFGVSWQLNLE